MFGFEESGLEPSGGKAQKFAIVRVFYKDSPIIILDEPTVALDPIVEYEVYKNFDSLVGGKTAVYISHRVCPVDFVTESLSLMIVELLKTVVTMNS